MTTAYEIYITEGEKPITVSGGTLTLSSGLFTIETSFHVFG
jgi:hypothetical protein